MNNEALQAYITTLSKMFEQAEEAARPGLGDPPWSHLFDPDLAPNGSLAWLGQWVGVPAEIRSSLEDPVVFYARQRQRIADHLGWNRGSAAAMKAVVKPLLTGNKSVFFQERDTSAYRITVITRTAETPDVAAVQRALISQKPAGIVLNYVVTAGRTFQETTAIGATFATSQTTWPLFSNRRGT